LLALALLPLASAAQMEVPRPVEASHPIEAPHPIEADRLSRSPGSGGRIVLEPGEHLRVSRERDVFEHELGHPPVQILWKKSMGANHQIKYDAFRQDPNTPPPGIWIDGNALMAIQNSHEPVIHTGEVPSGPKWQEFTSTHNNVVIHPSGSQNANLASITLASALGATMLEPRTTRIFNALPQQTDAAASLRERHRMGLDHTGTAEAWRSVNDEIRATTKGYETHVATRQALLDELQHGSSDVVIVYAHFDGKMLHLPGDAGTLAENTITVSDLAKMNRVGDPAVRERIIVLAACSTASPVNGQSLAQVLLKTGIARTVFATDRPYDAREIGDLMTRLKSNSVRSAGGQLHQYVELHFPERFRAADTPDHE